MFGLTYSVLSLTHTLQQIDTMDFGDNHLFQQSFDLSQKLSLNMHMWKQPAYILKCIC